VDVEDWYQSSHDLNAAISKICVTNTRKVLDFLSVHHTKGTFFVQGMVAKAFPKVVKEIHDNGHEIQSHGYSHRPINRMTAEEFLKELRETSARLEDITGEAVSGFRAPDFSIDRESFWAFEVMIEAGLSYDSSLFPMKTNRYGVGGFKRGYSLIRTASGVLEELTVSVDEIMKVRIPVGGGGYIRLLPLWLLRSSLNRFHRNGVPFVIYCHPYEFNPKEWGQMLSHISRYRRLHQGLGRGAFGKKISSLLKTRTFGTMSRVLCYLREGNRENSVCHNE
jgi:polysaccharide deacetylase family protein (PEP-CTERM system associated)